MRSKREAVALELAAIAEAHGSLRPDVVVSWARKHKRSALHSKFTWDDTKAAREYRLWQARVIITEVEVVYPDGKVRQLYVSPIGTRKTSGYQSLIEVMNRKETRAAYLAQALAELERVTEKYRDLVELAEVRQAVRKARAAARRGGRKLAA